MCRMTTNSLMLLHSCPKMLMNRCHIHAGFHRLRSSVNHHFQCRHLSQTHRLCQMPELPKTYGVPKNLVRFLPVPDKIRSAVMEAVPEKPSHHKQHHTGYESLLKATRPFTCRIESYNSYANMEYILTSGSGFVFHREGLIATNSHIVNNLPYCRVVMNSGQVFQGKVEWVHQRLGLAIVRVPDKSLPAITLSESKDSQIIAITGIPDKEHIQPDPITKEEPFFPLASAISELDWLERLYQNEGPDNLGHIGGPIVNRFAEAVAVADMDEEKDPVGIPVEYLKYYLMGKAHESVILFPRVYGLLLFEKSISFMSDFDLPPTYFGKTWKGIVVVQSVAGTPPYEAGLRVNDVITQVNGEEARPTSVVFALTSNKDVALTVMRKDEKLMILMPFDKWPINSNDSWLCN